MSTTVNVTSDDLGIVAGHEDDAETVEVTSAAPDGPPVDRPGRKPVFAAVVSKDDKRRPIVPATLRRGNIGPTVKHATGAVAHRAGFHAYRSPLYLLLASFWAVIGVFRLVIRLVKWWWVTEQYGLRQEAASNNDVSSWMRLHHEAKATRLFRGYVLLGGLVGLVVGAVLLWLLAPSWAVYLVVATAVPVLAHVGRPIDKPIVGPAVIKPVFRELTANQVRDALVSLRIPQIKEPGDVKFPEDIHADGPGKLAIVDLPLGVDAVEILEKRSGLASGLRRPVDQVWPETDPRAHPGRLKIWVGYEPASAMKQPPWPLLKAGKVDIFKPFPLLTDPRLRTVTGGLMYRNWLIGAMPGAGKTFFLRLLLLAAALDPRADLMGYELKGTGDCDMVEPVCTQFGSGIDDDTIEEALDMLRWLFAECQRRAPIIKRMAKAGKAPENKVTPELAGMRDLGLRPIVAFIDECQMLFAHKLFGAEAGELAENVIKLGRAYGIILILATQRPDKDSLPKGVSANAGNRFCLRVTGQVENDMVLGTSMYKQGIRATQFTDEDLGWGWLVGQGKPTIGRGYKVDGPAAVRIIERALELRRGAGTVKAEPRERVKVYNLVEDVHAVWPDGEDKVWSETILARLAELRPEVYTGWTADLLAKALKPYGIATDQVWGTTPDGKGANRRGITRADLAAVVAERRKTQIGSSGAGSGA